MRYDLRNGKGLKVLNRRERWYGAAGTAAFAGTPGTIWCRGLSGTGIVTTAGRLGCCAPTA